MGRNATSKIGVNAVTGRGYNPSVAPKARQLPLHRGAENALSHRGARRSNYARLWRADLIRHGAAPRRSPAPPSPRGKANHTVASVPPSYKNVPRPAAHINICPKGANISHARSTYFTAAQRRFHTAACRRISLRRSRTMCRDPRHTLTFAPKGQIFHTRGARISPPRSGDFTRRLAAVFHCGAAAQCAATRGTH